MIRGQTKTKKTNAESRGVANRFGDVVSDISDLVELQFELFKLECAESRRVIVRSVAYALVAVTVLLGSVPVGLLAAAAAISEFTGLSTAASTAIAFAAGLLLTAGCALAAWFAFKKATSQFERSKKELKQNIEWLKQLRRRGEPQKSLSPAGTSPTKFNNGRFANH